MGKKKKTQIALHIFTTSALASTKKSMFRKRLCEFPRFPYNAAVMWREIGVNVADDNLISGVAQKGPINGVCGGCENKRARGFMLQ